MRKWKLIKRSVKKMERSDIYLIVNSSSSGREWVGEGDEAELLSIILCICVFFFLLITCL